MIDIAIEANDMINNMLVARVKQLEKIVVDMQNEKKKDDIYIEKLVKEIKQLKYKPDQTFPPSQTQVPNNNLASVHEEHLPDLRGFSLRFKALGNGACVTNCAAVHVYEDEDEGPKVKRRVNLHMADNWDSYYKNKISLPYIETIGVGEHSKTVIITSGEEMIDFLRSDDALLVYSNSQELIALSNIFNINISIFTFGGSQGGHKYVQTQT